jgi:hypothetical protein
MCLGKRRLMAIDGVNLDVPDIPANIAGFGRPGRLARRPFPKIQVAVLGACGTHAVVGAETGVPSTPLSRPPPIRAVAAGRSPG